MRSASMFVALAAALMLAFSPGLALARAGAGGSFGSRGSYTFSAPPATRTAPYSASPIQRSFTPERSPSQGYGYGYNRPGYGSGFGSGLLGGLIGVGLGSMLFGHGFGFGFFGLFGLLIRIAIIVFVVRWLIRLFRRSTPAFAGGPSFFGRSPQPGPGPLPMGSGAPSAGSSGLEITPADFNTFQGMLSAVQDAWTRHDLQALSSLATPEMVSFFSEQLADQVSRGVRNEVTDVALLQGDLAQSWREQGREFATVAMRFSMIDVTRDGSGRVVDGSPAEHTTATELWTFVRVPGGRWLLSAIQQGR